MSGENTSSATDSEDGTRTLALTTEDILARFDALGLRNTRPRRLIAERLAALAASGKEFTAQELWEELLAHDPHMGRATVYRAVDLLLELGLLDRVSFADGSHCFRVCGRGRHHHHLTCTQCQRVIEINACFSQEEMTSIAALTGFIIDGHQIELFGRCAACRGAKV
ncbi:MAG TPA: transcriptional repressor [Ktedonobacterales bacterium]|nr:transcriptional repressor [Ktedonobacterales bacterium]